MGFKGCTGAGLCVLCGNFRDVALEVRGVIFIEFRGA